MVVVYFTVFLQKYSNNTAAIFLGRTLHVLNFILQSESQGCVKSNQIRVKQCLHICLSKHKLIHLQGHKLVRCSSMAPALSIFPGNSKHYKQQEECDTQGRELENNNTNVVRNLVLILRWKS